MTATARRRSARAAAVKARNATASTATITHSSEPSRWSGSHPVSASIHSRETSVTTASSPHSAPTIASAQNRLRTAAPEVGRTGAATLATMPGRFPGASAAWWLACGTLAAVSVFRIRYEGPAALAVGIVRELADADGIDLVSSDPPEVREPGTVALDVAVEATDADVASALTRIRSDLPAGATIAVVDG